jgi:hypothetical protein
MHVHCLDKKEPSREGNHIRFADCFGRRHYDYDKDVKPDKKTKRLTSGIFMF